MAKVLVSEENLTNIANAIREKNGETTTYKPSEMAGAIQNISSGSLTITENGIYDVTNYASANVNVSSGGSSGIKIEFQTYTPTEDEITHTFTHNLGTVPDIIMIYHGCMPSFYSKQSTEATLISAWGLKRNSTIFSNGQSRYARNFYCISQNASNDEYGKCGMNFDDGIESTSTSCLLKNATSDSFMFDGSKSNSAHLGKELTYYIILISGVNE